MHIWHVALPLQIVSLSKCPSCRLSNGLSRDVLNGSCPQLEPTTSHKDHARSMITRFTVTRFSQLFAERAVDSRTTRAKQSAKMRSRVSVFHLSTSWSKEEWIVPLVAEIESNTVSSLRDLAPKFYPVLSSPPLLDLPGWAVEATGAGAEPSA